MNAFATFDSIEKSIMGNICVGTNEQAKLNNRYAVQPEIAKPELLCGAIRTVTQVFSIPHHKPMEI